MLLFPKFCSEFGSFNLKFKFTDLFTKFLINYSYENY